MTVTLARSWNETLRDQLDFHYRQLFRRSLEHPAPRHRDLAGTDRRG